MASKAHATSLLLTLGLLLLFITLSSCAPTPSPSPAPPSQQAHCPMDALKLHVCANVLNLVNVGIGSSQTTQCCGLLAGLVDLDAAACLCTALRANVMGINLDIQHSLSLVLNKCGKNNSGFQCN